MKDILTEIIANKRMEVNRDISQIALRELIAASKDMPPVRSMSQALASSKSGIIAEFKRRSPSKGWINEKADSSIIPAEYALHGAAALSILTDEKYFGGSLKDIETARTKINIPIIRKEFIIDEYQLYQARLVGADAVLLIAAALTIDECKRLIDIAHNIGLEVLLELHSEKEFGYIQQGVEMIGINNRNLGSFHTDVANSFRLIEMLPKSAVLVSESGISNPRTVSELREVGYRGFLIGESFMRSEFPAQELSKFISNIEL